MREPPVRVLGRRDHAPRVGVPGQDEVEARHERQPPACREVQRPNVGAKDDKSRDRGGIPGLMTDGERFGILMRHLFASPLEVGGEDSERRTAGRVRLSRQLILGTRRRLAKSRTCPGV